MDLYNELQQKIKDLEVSIRQLRTSGTKYAEAERDYKVLLRQEVLKLRDEGTAIGVIDKICYGIPSVADARFKRDVSEAIYKANLEAINSIKLKLLEKAGKIKELELQKEFELQPSYKLNNKTIRKITYRADFTYKTAEDDKLHVIDVKGYRTDVYRLKKKLFEYRYKIEIEEIKWRI